MNCIKVTPKGYFFEDVTGLVNKNTPYICWLIICFLYSDLALFFDKNITL